MRLYNKISGATAVAISTVVITTSCAGPTSTGKKQDKAIPVRVLTVTTSQNTGTDTYVGTADASKSTYISSRYPGTLVSLHVKKGDNVSKGDILAEIESQNVLTTYEMSQATLKRAKDGYRRALQVHESGSMADVKMVEVETQLAQAEAAAKAAEKALEECRLKAPFDAVVSDILSDQGVEVNPLENILRLLDISSIQIHFPVPENEVGSISKGDPASISIPALGLQDIKAHLTAKGIVASPLSHTYECTLVPDSTIPGLMPGMVVKVRMDRTAGEGVIVPSSVIRTDTGGRYLWTVSPEGIVCKTYVTPAGFSGHGVVISEGLSEGDKVITEGVQKVCTGMRVTIIQ